MAALETIEQAKRTSMLGIEHDRESHGLRLSLQSIRA
jgi:hypothetical protein